MLMEKPRVTPSHQTGEVDGDRLLGFIHSAGGAFRHLRSLLDRQVQPYGIDGGECLVLWLCATRARHAGWAQQDLANAIGVSPALMSSLVEGLRKRGLMEMKRSPVDRRRQVWQLLSQGEELLKKIRGNLGGVAEQLESLVPIPDQEVAQQVFARITQPLAANAPILRTYDPDGLSGRTCGPATTEQGGGR